MVQPKIDSAVVEKIDERIDAANIRPSRSASQSMPPTTTAEQDLRTKGQRDVNMRWENTQAILALFVVAIASLVSATVVIIAVFYRVSGVSPLLDSMALAAFTMLASQAALVSGFYFGRTNHARIGDEPRRGQSTGGLDDR